MPRIAPYGSWTSPVTADVLVERVVRLGDPRLDGTDLYWVEGRPTEGGREVVVRFGADGVVEDVLPAGYGARTTVHEYGGLSYAVRDGCCYFANFSDQRLYRVDRGGLPEPLTADPPEPSAWRYAAPIVTPDGAWILCVRETHAGAEVVNELVAVASADGAVDVLASGHDFYGTPALSPDGRHLAWCTWDHPRMPWDGTELHEAELLSGAILGPQRVVAGGEEESVTQPRYAPDGTLHFVSDRTGWWNIYADRGAGGPVSLAPCEAELASPDWVFGLSSYALLEDGTICAAWADGGVGHLGVLEPGSSELEPVQTPYTSFAGLCPTATGVVAVAASPALAPSVVEIALGPRAACPGAVVVHRASRESVVGDAYLSTPWRLHYETGGGLVAHATVYPPTNPDFVAPEGEKPPLIVAIHGGPTSSASSALNYSIQYWTSRGFAVADVDYGGSSGYGRAYRQRLAGAWSVVDVEDCERAALALAARGLVDPDRLCIHGGSAGGYTTLCATTFGDVFAAGASYYGVADAGALARDTHKFESHYLDGLIGPWPEARAVYEERSPIFATDRMSTPLAIFQGSQDKVVPPAQAEMMVDALRRRGVPVAYVLYEGEQHGFRKAESIKRTAEAELSFYGQVLGFEPAGDVDPVVVDNEDAIARRAR